MTRPYPAFIKTTIMRLRSVLTRVGIVLWPESASLVQRIVTFGVAGIIAVGGGAMAAVLSMQKNDTGVPAAQEDGTQPLDGSSGEETSEKTDAQDKDDKKSEDNKSSGNKNNEDENPGSGGQQSGSSGSSGGGGSDGGGGSGSGSGSTDNNGSCAWPKVPDASCTGVPAGTQLTTHNGDLYVTTNGAVVDKMEVNGCIYIQANNVTIKRTKVNGACWTGAISTGYGEYSGTLIEDVEVDGGASSSDVAGMALIGVNNYTARRVNVHDGGRGFNMGDNVTIEDSYIHNVYGFGDSHNSGIGSNSGTNITIRHNNIRCDIGQPGNPSSGGGCSGALVLYADTFEGQSGTIDNLLVEQNLFNAGPGSYCLLLYNGRTNASYVIRNNLFGVSFYPDCGQYGPADIIKTAGASLTWQNNTWYAPGQSKHGQSVTPEITIQ